MIRSFRSRPLKRYWTKGDERGINQDWIQRVRLILSTLDDAPQPGAMDLPGLKFHRLKGDRDEEYAVSVTGNWRITCGWGREDAVDVDLEDYHGR